MKFAIQRITLGVALALAVLAPADAGTIISTLANPALGTDVNSETNAAQGFITGSQAQSLMNVTLELIGGNGSAVVSLLYDSGVDSPGSLAETIGTINPTGNTYAEYTLTAPAFTLAANTTYWLAVEYSHVVTPDSPGPWAFTNAAPPNGPGFTVTGSGTLGYFAGSFDGGASWYTASAYEYGPYMMGVNAAAVPEPSALVLATIAALFGIGAKTYSHCRGNVKATA